MSKAKRKNNVSKRLGLKPLSGKATIGDYQERKKYLTRKINGGKLSGVLLQRANEYVRHYDFRIRRMKNLTARQAQLNNLLEQGQLQLPGFLKQMSTVRIEELVAQKVAQMINTEIKAQIKTSTFNKKAPRKAS